MTFISDLHIHSKYSRATAKNLDLENLWIAAQIKGITVVGTGDFTHPAWFDELKKKLEPAEPGLFKLKEEIAVDLSAQVPDACRGPVRFMLVSEISNIYKKNGKTRKNHNLIFAPGFDVAENINRRLDAIGNIHSDGRPILGLDARNLLEIILEVSSDTFLVPAHIWTPWFSVLGSKSGFDAIEECFEDLTDHIFALETGLSSDPPMNWRISSLDRFTLISNSDAHSPMKLGREANLFNTELSYFAIRTALETHDPQKFLGTFEFYPEEGKYHVDGHRKCQVRLQPSETMALDNNCPVCGKPLTLGVLYRVEQLADRSEGEKPAHAGVFHNLVPLENVLSELLKSGSGSKKVQLTYHRLVHKLGPEFTILHDLPIADINEAGVPLLGEAIGRVREKNVHFSPGYDGEFGKVEIFSVEEREELLNQKRLFDFAPAAAINRAVLEPAPESQKRKKKLKTAAPEAEELKQSHSDIDFPVPSENVAQQTAVTSAQGPLLIVAGPGTGKTFTLTQRILHLVDDKKVPADKILAVTFTRKAALEMRTRLETILTTGEKQPLITTFHGLCWRLIQENCAQGASPGIIDPDDRLMILRDAMAQVQKQTGPLNSSDKLFLEAIVVVKQSILRPDEIQGQSPDLAVPLEELERVYAAYQQILNLNDLLDYEDVIFSIVRRLEEEASFRSDCRARFAHIFVDEYQDLNEGQYRIIRALAPDVLSNICVIGDPDQAIYGFRGSDVAYFNRFQADYPDAKVIRLSRNYRSTEAILESSFQVIRKDPIRMIDTSTERIYSGINGTRTISILKNVSEKAEAVAIGRTIEQMVGGMGFHAVDFDKLQNYQEEVQRSFSDFAVLFRTHDQGRVLMELLEKAGIPCQLASRDTFLNAPGIKAMLALLRVICGTGSFVDFEHLSRCLTPALSKEIISDFKNWAYEKNMCLQEACLRASWIPITGMSAGSREKLLTFLDSIASLGGQIVNHPLHKKLEVISQLPGVQKLSGNSRDFHDALKKLVDRSTSFELETNAFLSALALDSDTDHYDDKAERVALLTMHAAKGLEFPVVFIAGCEEGLIPFAANDGKHSNLSEERRLFYVAMTRARERLFLSWATKRRVFGKLVPRKMSPFVLDIEKNLQKHVAAELKSTPAVKQTQLTLF